MPNTEINFDEHYAVEGYRGIAFYLLGFATETVEVQITDEFEDGPVYFYDHETVEDRSMVRAVMVGDNREHIVDVDDLTMIADEDYCPECGQIGCSHGR